MGAKPTFVQGHAASLASLVKQAPGRNAKWLCELLQDGNCGIAASALDVAYVGSVNVGAVRKILLTPAILLPKAANVSAKASAYVHAGLKTVL